MLYNQKLAEELKLKLLELKAEVVEDEDFMFDVIATTQDPDRENEIIEIAGWDKKNWKKNPVVLANHSYTIENIIGRGIDFYERDGVMRLKGTFSKSNPLGVLAWKLYQEDMLNAVSVGFIPLQRNANNSKIIEKAELLEVSFVAVPCNPNAIRDGKLYEEALSKGLIVEEKALEAKILDDTLKAIVKAEMDNENIGVYVVATYADNIVYNVFGDDFDLYYKRDYTNKDGNFTFGEEIKEVKPTTTRVEKALQMKGNGVLINKVINIENILKGMTDDKVKEENEAIAKKEVLQAINRATATALENIKKLQN